MKHKPSSGPFIPIFHQKEVTSTMDQARVLIKKTLPPFAVYADTQTVGRGRWGRLWHDQSRGHPPNLMVTFVLHKNQLNDKIISDLCAKLALCVPVSLMLFLKDSGRVCQIKWPNDVLFKGAKAGGVLIEMDDCHVFIGVGLNTLFSPTGLSQNVTHLDLNIERTFLIQKIYTGIMAQAKRDLAALIATWRCYSFLKLGDKIAISNTNGVQLHAKYIDIDSKGFLLYKDPNGRDTKTNTGDVIVINSKEFEI